MDTFKPVERKKTFTLPSVGCNPPTLEEDKLLVEPTGQSELNASCCRLTSTVDVQQDTPATIIPHVSGLCPAALFPIYPSPSHLFLRSGAWNEVGVMETQAASAPW